MLGQRNDLEDLKVAIREGKRGLELMEEHSNTYAKYPRFVHAYIRALEESRVQLESFVPRDGWQQELMDTLSGPVSDRTVIWIYDLQGNKGKSYFARNYPTR